MAGALCVPSLISRAVLVLVVLGGWVHMVVLVVIERAFKRVLIKISSSSKRGGLLFFVT